jgi:hypothetical protein
VFHILTTLKERFAIDRSQSDISRREYCFGVKSLARYRLLSLFIMFPLVLNGCETRSLTLREEHGLRVFENRVMRRIFGPKRNEVKGGVEKTA